MESANMEYDGKEAVPFLKQESNEFPLNFIFSDNKPDQNPSNCDKSQVIPSLLPSASVAVPPPHDISISIRIDADDRAKQDGLPSQVQCPDVSISESLPSLGCESRNGVAGHSLFSSSSSPNVPVVAQVYSLNLNPFDVEMPVAAQVLQSQSGDKERSSHYTEAADLNLKKSVFDPSATVGDCVAIPAEELSAYEQISIKADEVFINGGEEQFHSDRSDRATISESVHDGVRNGEVLDKSTYETNAKNTKETPAVRSLKPFEDAPIFIRNRAKTRIRRKKAESPNAVEKAFVSEDVKEKENTKKMVGSEETEQQTQSSPNDFDGACFRRMPSKICERKRTLQNRYSSVSGLLPKPCRIQIQKSAEKKLLQGLGVKRYHCTVCKGSFNRRQQLRTHVLEVHEGKPCSNNNISYQPSVSMTFTCPLCNISYARKYGLKRHFASKHSNATKIPCPECKYKAKTLVVYLQHIVKHKPKPTEARNSSPTQESQSHNSQLKCRDCFKLFQNSDALRLHVIDHKIILCLSQVESLLSSDNCSCISNEDKPSTDSSLCALHMPRSNLGLREVHGRSLLNILPQELKLEVEHSLDVILKLTSQLDFLARTVSTLNTSWGSEIPLPAINHISTLSSELTNLSTTLWHILHCHVIKKKEKDTKTSVDDPVVEISDSESKAVDEREEVVLESDEEIVQTKVEGLFQVFEEDSDGLAQEKDAESLQPQDEEFLQESNEQAVDDKNVGGGFQENGKEFVQKNDKQAIVEESAGAIFREKDKGSVQEKVEQTIFEEHEGEILPEKDEGFVQENYEGLVLEEVDDFALVQDLVMNKFPGEKTDEAAKETSLGQALVVSPPRKNPKRSERQALTNMSSKIQIRRSKRQALNKASKAESKASVQPSLPASKHSKADAKHPRRGRGRTTLKKMIDRSRSSKSGDGYKCPECGKNFTKFRGLRRHLLIHTDHRPFKCMVCNMSFRRNEHLKKHVVKHSDERPFKCDLCDYAAKTSKTLHGHSLTHGAHQRFSCKKCSYKGRTAYELSKHERKHNPCSLCSYVASDVADYKLHRRSHVVYSCTECNYSCYASWQLKRHTIKHKSLSDVEKLSCELCGYSCIDKRRLAYHMTRHKNKTPLSCSICDYKCSSRASFDAHKLMHAGLKPYLCSICGASFRRPSTLNNHMLVHKEEKQHVCRTCGRPFRARQNLKAHEMIHTGERKYKCQLCDFACRRNRELTLHMNKHKLLDGGEKDSKTSDSPCDSKAG